jgi:hypothetical protein
MNTNVKTATRALGAIASVFRSMCLQVIALLAALSSSSAQTATPAPDAQTQINTKATEPGTAKPKISANEIDSLVGPIALYPDPLLTQVLAASTYPLEVVQLKQWLDKNKTLKDTALAETVAQQNWDPSVQGLAGFPAVVEKLADNIQWTTDLGNAFLAQESDLMDSVQRLRAKAHANGALKTNDKQKVATETTRDGKEAITIESAQREVVYVPTYKTEYVYRDSDRSTDSSSYSSASGYSNDSDYGDSYVGYAAAAATGYYWGYYNWRDRYAGVNRNNYYVKNYNAKWSSNVSNRSNYSQRLSERGGKWQHDPSHRGSAPYSNSSLASRFGQANNRFSSSRLPNQAAQSARTTAPKGDLARASRARGAQSLRPPGAFRGGPPKAVRGGPPANLPGGSAPMGRFPSGPPIGGGMPMGPPPMPPHP